MVVLTTVFALSSLFRDVPEHADLTDSVIRTELPFAAEGIVYDGVVRKPTKQCRKMPFRIAPRHGDEARKPPFRSLMQFSPGIWYSADGFERIQEADQGKLKVGSGIKRSAVDQSPVQD